MWYRAGRVVGLNRRVPWPVHFTTTVRHPSRVRLGRETYPGDSPGCYLNALNGIIVGDRVNLGPGVGLISANHDLADNTRYIPAPPIRIGADSWIGMNAVILPGVELGEHTIVGANAVVTRSFPEGHCVLGGNPARILKLLDPSTAPSSRPPSARRKPSGTRTK
jgi:acetyltransferase-like isoleucine patch superfamily enzyme